jgi:predicted nucleotidyltransferase component of viral defense system
MPELHTRLLADVLAIGSPYLLVLTGGYAVRAHRLVDRPSQDLDVATENPTPMADIAAALRSGPEARSCQVKTLETAPLSARFTVSDPVTGQGCEVDILKEIFWRPITQSPYGPVLAEEDVIGTKVRALADRGAPRDLIDVFAASRRWTSAEL